MKKKKIASVLMTGILSVVLVGQSLAAPVEYGEELKNAPQTTPSISFNDLTGNHWAYSYIAEMVSKKVLDGYPDKKFRPENTISRAEFATIIVKAAGLQAQKVNYSNFSDVKITDWYSPYIETVKDYMTGYRTADGQYIFNPTAPALREDIVIAMVKLKGYDVSRLANRSIIEAMFRDYDGISESAKDYVAIAVEHGLVSGYEDETFRAQNSITRAEGSTMLWRAFMYGNDNKGVGGSGETATAPTEPVTQPSTNPQPTAPAIPNLPQQPSLAAKFSVDTLVGGTGAGDVDGPVSMAKINAVNSMIVDKDDNVYFLDANKLKVRKFNNSNGYVETFKQIDSSFNWGHSKDGKNVTNYLNTSMFPVKLAYNMANNSVYLGVQYSVNPYGAFVYQLTPSVQMAVYSLDTYKSTFDFIEFDNQDVTFSKSAVDSYGDADVDIFSGKYQAEKIASTSDRTWIHYIGGKDRYNPAIKVDAIVFNNNIFVFDANSGKLSKIQLFPRKVENVVTHTNIIFDSLTTYNGKFYASSATTIYELSTDGSLATFIDGKDITYNDGNPIEKISHMSFDSKGNIIVYDDANKAIRRINQ